MIVEEIDHATSLATQRKVDARILLPEIEGLLISATRKIFDRMSEIDRRLRGNGFPESVPIRTTQVEFNRVQAFISERIQAELSMSKPKPWYEEWLEANKFKTWMIGTGIAVTGLIFTLELLFLNQIH